jgi:hypothetical protein
MKTAPQLQLRSSLDYPSALAVGCWSQSRYLLTPLQQSMETQIWRFWTCVHVSGH